MVICLEQGADLHMAQLMPLPHTVSCFSKIQIGFAFLVPAHPGSPGQRAVKRVYVTSLLFMCCNLVCFQCCCYYHYECTVYSDSILKALQGGSRMGYIL